MGSRGHLPGIEARRYLDELFAVSNETAAKFFEREMFDIAERFQLSQESPRLMNPKAGFVNWASPRRHYSESGVPQS